MATVTISVGNGAAGEVTVADFLGAGVTPNEMSDAFIANTAANVAANIDAIEAAKRRAAIRLTDPGTPTLMLTAAQAVNDRYTLRAITNAKYAVSVSDTAKN